MKRLLTAAVLLACPAFARAAPFDAKIVPAASKIVLHVDVDALKTSKVWGIISERLAANTQAQAKLKELEFLTGAKFPDSYHDLTLFAPAPGDKNGVVVIHAEGDQDKLLNAAKMNADYSNTPYGSHELITWTDKGKNYVGTLFDKRTIVMGRSKELVTQALDTLDGKGEPLSAQSPLTAGARAGAGPGLLMYMAGDGLLALQKERPARSPLAGQVESAWLAVQEQDKNLATHAVVHAVNNDAAAQMQKGLEGIKSMVLMAGDKEDATETDQVRADAITTLKSKAEGSQVTVDWPVPLELLQKAVAARLGGGPKQPPADPGVK